MSIQALRELTYNNQIFVTTNCANVEAALAEYDLLRAVVEAADKYDRKECSYPALRLALNKWRKAEREKEKGETE